MAHAQTNETWVNPHVTRPVVMFEEVLERDCIGCGTHFQTRSRMKRRCDACQQGVNTRRQLRQNEALKHKRRLRRMGALLG